MNEANQFEQLTYEEKNELIEALASGGAYIFCDELTKTDEFLFYRLNSGRNVWGKYEWDSPNGEFIELSISE